MDKIDWAKKEIEIACDKSDEYVQACYESALKAFESLCEDGHSGYTIRITRHILDRLINGSPLTPIIDTDDIWNVLIRPESDESPDVSIYQCKRMSSLFKYVYRDGHIEYRDIDRVVCVDVDSESGMIDAWHRYFSSLVSRVIDKEFPIIMPYMPGKPILVQCESFACDSDCDTIFGIYNAIFTEDAIQKFIPINRFFKDVMNEWVEITKDEYDRRKNNI